ncbi:MAG: NADH-quinone oxidoreductase subunit N [Acidimicrobiia bacterium]|nr:NADH-quinone oxidoreductase subunit N [Acidimicrobiia bacterium]MDH3469934.1 NADH-quinone oxidoreductase subunit N [Acidimicrobiia bacterium]
MIDYHALAPELILAGTLVGVLLLDLLPVEKYWTAVLALTGLVAAAVPLLSLALLEEGERSLFSGSYVVDDYALVLKGLFIVTGFIALLMSVGYLELDRYYQGEFYFLLLASVIGAVVMASSRDLISIFIGVELVSIPGFLLAGWRKGDARSNEAALKFFIIGVLSSAVMLFGMSIVYGVTGSIDFAGIAAASAGLVDEPAMILGVLLVIAGFGFKVSAVPFHFWVPDTYEGSPTPVAAFLSVGSKAAGFVGLLSLCFIAFAELKEIWGPAIWILAAASMTIGNLVALRQTNIVRLLGYSSIAHGGFILVPFAMAASFDQVALGDAFSATVTYLLIYAFMNLGAFAVVIAVSRKINRGDIAGWAGLFTYAPGLATLATIFFFSLAGLPPLAGWFAKFVMFRAVLGGGANTWAVVLAAIAAVNAVVALYYYAKIVKSAWMDPVPESIASADARETQLAPSLSLALGIAAVGVVAVGFFPQVLAFFGDATRALALGG